MAESTASENRNSSWDGTSGSGKATPYVHPVDEGDMSPEIRGTAKSSLQSDELAHIRQATSPKGDTSQWPRKGDSGQNESAQSK